MIRTATSVIGGIVTALVVMIAFEFTNSFFYPFPEGFDTGNLEQVKRFIDLNSPNIFLLVIAGWMFGSLLGGFVATKLARKNGIGIGIVTGCIFTILQLLNFQFLPHPVWAMVIGLVGAIPMFIAGSKLALPRFIKN